jgi:hypothetical protein
LSDRARIEEADLRPNDSPEWVFHCNSSAGIQ